MEIFQRLKVTSEVGGDILTISKPRTGQLPDLIRAVLGILTPIAMLFWPFTDTFWGRWIHGASLYPSFLALFYFLWVALFVPNLMVATRILIFGERFVFDRRTRTVSLDGRMIAKFRNLARVKIWSLKSQGMRGLLYARSYSLFIVLQNDGKKIRIARSKNYDEIYRLAVDIAKVVNRAVMHTRTVNSIFWWLLKGPEEEGRF